MPNQQVMDLLITATNKTSAELARVRADIAAVSTEVGDMNAKMAASAAAADASTAKVTKHTSSYLRLGVAMGTVGVLVDALGVKSATALDTAEHHVTALTSAIGTGVGQISLGKLETEIRQLSDETGISTTKLTQSFYSVASSSLDAARSLEITRQASKFAAASQTDDAVAIQLLTALTNSYHLSLQQIPQAQDTVTQAVKLATGEAKDFAPALLQIVPTAHQLGISLSDLSAMMVVVNNSGTSLAQSGTYVQNMLNRLLNPTNNQVRAVEALDGKYKDLIVTHGNVFATLSRINDLIIKSVPDVKSLENAHGDLTARQARFVEQLGQENGKVAALFGNNTSAMKAFFDLFANGGDRTRQTLEGMSGSAGATEKAFSDMADSASLKFKQFSVQLDQATQAIGKDLLPQLEALAKIGGPVASGTGDLIRQHQALGTVLADTGVALSGVVAGYYAWKFIGEPVAVVIGKITTAVEESTVAMGALDLALSPEAGLLLALAAAGVAAYEMVPPFRQGVDDMGSALSKDLSDSVTVGVGALKELDQHLHDIENTFHNVAKLDWAGLFKKGLGVPDAPKTKSNGVLDTIGTGLFGSGGLQLPGLASDMEHLLGVTNPTVKAFEDFVTIMHQTAQAQREAEYAARQHTIALGDQFKVLAGGFTGSGVPKVFPQASFGGAPGTTSSSPGADPFNVAKTIKDAEQNIGKFSQAVINDTNTFGPHSQQVANDREKLAANISTYQKYNTQLSDLANTTGKLKDVQTQAEKEYAAVQQKYQDALVQGAVDVATFGHVLPAHAQALDQARTKALAMSDAMNSLQGKTSHTASALDILNAAALKGQALPAMYDAAAEAQKKLADKSMKLADVFAEVERRAGDYSAYLGQFNKRLQDTLTNAEGRLAFDQGPKGDKSRIGADKDAITAAQKNIDAWSSSVSDATGAAKGFSFVLQQQQSKLQDAVSTAEGKLISDQNTPGTSHKTILADEQAVRSANARLNAFNKELSDLTPSMTHLESAAEKAAKALQKIEDALKKPGAEGAEAANRAGQYNAMFGTGKGSLDPRNFATEGDWEKAVQKANDAFWKTHAFVGGEITTKGAGALSVLRHDPTALAGESKADLKTIGVTVAALLQDPTILGYLEKESPKQLQAIGVSPSQIVDAETAKRQKALSDAEAKRDLDILQGHTSALAADKEKITKASEALDAWTGVVNSSATAINTYAGPKGFQGANFGNVGNAAAPPPSIAATVSGGGFAATAPGVISGGKALENVFANLVTAGMANVKSQEVQTHANYQIAKNTGDTATEFSILDTAFLAGKTSLDGLPITLGGVVQAYNENQATVLATTQRLIAFDQATGNTADALTQTQALYLQGNASLTQLDQAYNDNQVTVAKNTQQMQAFYASTGQFGQLLTSISSGISQDVTDSQAKVTLDILTGNTAAFKSDTDAAIAHRQAQEALTNATWDSTYATANAATQSQMRQSLASPMVSQQSTIQGLASGVFNAQLGVIAARSAVVVSEMQAEVTATNDLVGIVQAQSAVAKAQGDKQLAAVNDSIPIMNDQHAIMVDLKNGNTQQLQIDRQQLLIDRTTAQMDQVVGQMQVTIALDGLKAAQDKMMVDQMNASAAYAVAVDNLTLAQDAVTLAEAEQQLGIDQLTVLNNIDTTLGSVTDYLNLIDSDLQNLQAAQDQQQSDQLQLANDTADQNYTNMAGQGILAGDTLGQAGDQAALQQQQQAYELQIAQYKVQLNAFQLQQSDSQTNGQSVAALQAMVKTLQAMLTTVHSPAGRAIQAAGVGANSWAAVQSGWNSTQIPMGFS